MRNKYLPSFVKRRGKITTGQIENLNSISNYEIKKPFDIDAHLLLYSKTILEIGFGNGENIIKLAKENLSNLYIGSEVYLAGIGHLIGNIKKDNLSNIKIINGDVRCFLEKVKQPLFDEIVIICPDPWPKLKHHKRRMINDEFLKLIYPTIKANGNLYISTDWENYAESINDVLKKSKIFVNKSLVSNTVSTPTKFQKKAITEGRKIFSFKVKKK